MGVTEPEKEGRHRGKKRHSARSGMGAVQVILTKSEAGDAGDAACVDR